MKESGFKTRDKAEAHKFGQTDQCMKDIGETERQTEEEGLSMLTEMSTMGIGRMIRHTAKEFIHT